MVRGTLEVTLFSAKGLEDEDLFGKMDPYAIISYRSDEKKSTVKKNAGSDPEWNENFVFAVSDDFKELHIKLMDEDYLTADDCIGQAKISLEPVFMEGRVPPTYYNVVTNNKDQGQVKVSLAFIPDTPHHPSLHKDSFGGWNESARKY